jgi:nitrate reductase (NAD(P)H)
MISKPNGNYGTSIKLSWVLTRERGIMLAHKQNGVPLTPDHGRPIRVVIPCMIGGRSASPPSNKKAFRI